VCEPHLDLLALAPRLLEGLSASERPGNVSGMFMDVARDLARRFLWAALRLEWANVAVDLACAIQKRLALVYGAARRKPLSARAVVDVVGRVISKVAAREDAIVAAAFGLGFSGIIPAYVLAVRELFPASEAFWRIPTLLLFSGGGMAGGRIAGLLYDHLGFYAPAFAVGANILNLLIVQRVGRAKTPLIGQMAREFPVIS
jgi:hypothetical protein